MDCAVSLLAACASVAQWAALFLEEAKANGTVRRALDGAGFTNAAVAPPAAPP